MACVLRIVTSSPAPGTPAGVHVADAFQFPVALLVNEVAQAEIGLMKTNAKATRIAPSARPLFKSNTLRPPWDERACVIRRSRITVFVSAVGGPARASP